MSEQNQQGQGDSTQQQNQQPSADYETWLAGQPAEVKQLAEAHVSGLKSALASEREQRKQLAGQLREATGKLEQDSEAAKSLQEIAGKLELAERRAVFFEEASRPEIGCANARAAFLLAQAGDLFKKDGSVDWKAVKEAAPELFGKRTTNVNAGVGVQSAAPGGKSMNDFIRRSAGVG